MKNCVEELLAEVKCPECGGQTAEERERQHQFRTGKRKCGACDAVWEPSLTPTKQGEGLFELKIMLKKS